MKDTDFVPVTKIFTIINSCETSDQLESCTNLIDNYVRQVKRKGVVNSNTLKKRLMQEYKQKCFQIKMITSFIQRDNKEYSHIFNKEIVKVG